MRAETLTTVALPEAFPVTGVPAAAQVREAVEVGAVCGEASAGPASARLPARLGAL